MENEIMKKINNARVRLDRVADTFGAARAANIALLAGDLENIRRLAAALTAEDRRPAEKTSDGERNFVKPEAP